MPSSHRLCRGFLIGWGLTMVQTPGRAGGWQHEQARWYEARLRRRRSRRWRVCRLRGLRWRGSWRPGICRWAGRPSRAVAASASRLIPAALYLDWTRVHQRSVGNQGFDLGTCRSPLAAHAQLTRYALKTIDDLYSVYRPNFLIDGCAV